MTARRNMTQGTLAAMLGLGLVLVAGGCTDDGVNPDGDQWLNGKIKGDGGQFPGGDGDGDGEEEGEDEGDDGLDCGIEGPEREIETLFYGDAEFTAEAYVGGGGMEVADLTKPEGEDEAECTLEWTAESNEPLDDCPKCSVAWRITYTGVDVLTDRDGACAKYGHEPSSYEGKQVSLGLNGNKVMLKRDGEWKAVGCAEVEDEFVYFDYSL